MITDRDNVVIEFLTNIPCYSNTINKIFYNSQRYCNHRLSYLYKYGCIKRNKRKHASEPYFYYAGKGKREPADKHKAHYDLIARAYKWMDEYCKEKKYTMLNVEVQKQVGKVKPDLLITLEGVKDGKLVQNILPIEIERSNNIENTIRKYEYTEFRKILLFSKRPFRKGTTIEIIDKRLSELK